MSRWLIGVCLAYLLLINGAVRYLGGGDPFLLSALFLPEKSYAVLSLSLHAATHLYRHDPTEPRALVAEAARAHGVPVRFALAIAHVESGLRAHSISAAGAMGIMQLMPETARRHGVVDPFNPADNVQGAARYLHELWQRYRGDSQRVAAAYNAGPGRVPREGPLDLPAETRVYVARVVSASR